MPKEHLVLFLLSLICLFSSFLMSYFLNKYLIVKEKKKSIAQAIREDIVKTHLKKNNTPTMGGIAIVGSTLIVSTLINIKSLDNITLLTFMFVLSSFFLIGFSDDYLKIKKKNSKGLSAKTRLVVELLLTLLVLIFLGYENQDKWRIIVPFTNNYLYLGILFIPLVILMFLGSSNGVNMADGLDGLASGLVFMAFTPFIIIFIKKEMYDIALFLLALDGSISGFLVHNFHPAKIFMGDSGSLPLGAILALSALVSEQIFLLLIAGGLFIVETLSVILQVASYKSFHKRIFKMAPLHHHFEMNGVAEWKVVMAFYIVGYILSFIALLFEVI